MSATELKLPTLEEATLPAGSLWAKAPLISGVIGVLALLASIGLGMSSREQYFFSYITAFMYCLSIALGGLFFIIMVYASRAGWGVVVRRIAENAVSTMPLFVLLFIPVIVGMHDLFHWTHAEAVAADPILQAKEGYLNQPFFFARAAIYFVVWLGMAIFFVKKSLAQDESGDLKLTKDMQWISGPAIVAFAFTLTFASFDWLMSLDPHWYSTIFGVYYFAGAVISIYAFMILIATGLGRSGILRDRINAEHYHDMGKMLFAFIVFWSYIAFSQFMLIWYSNIPEETVWFEHRTTGSWMTVTYILMIGHFAIPFFYMMPRTIKRIRPLVALGAVWMLAVHYIDIYWLVMPVLHNHGVHPSLLDITCLLAVGGLFFAVFTKLMAKRPLLPLKDPRLKESLKFTNI